MSTVRHRPAEPGASSASLATPPVAPKVLFEAAYSSVAAELRDLLPSGGAVIDAHTHLGTDEDGHSLTVDRLIEYLDQVDPDARAIVFPLHDPERKPAYRIPNDRVVQCAQESGGRLFAFCRLDPADDPVTEAKRCLTRGARGIKLHPRAQSFGFGDAAAEAIFQIARDASVPILIHAGRGMPSMTPLADLALRYPDVSLVLAHAGIADQAMFATLLAEHPRVVYDTSCFSTLDLVELFARVPAERIVFGSDVPYGRPAGGLFQAMRAATYAGLDGKQRALIAGSTISALLDGRPLAPATPPRLPRVRPMYGSLARISGYLSMSFAAAVTAGPPPDPARGLMGIQLARAVCRDPNPGAVRSALRRIDTLLAAAEQLTLETREQASLAFGLVMTANTIAATEPTYPHIQRPTGAWQPTGA
ncbi:MAG TPA: amidohydrolase family protein [Solirubrobacteraceae bacterium]|nr:amidohydrolase family protein [Solirubrobacteraceae bacterium]